MCKGRAELRCRVLLAATRSEGDEAKPAKGSVLGIGYFVGQGIARGWSANSESSIREQFIA